MRIWYDKKKEAKYPYMVNSENQKELDLAYKIQGRVLTEEGEHVNGWKLKWIIWLLEGLKEL